MTGSGASISACPPADVLEAIARGSTCDAAVAAHVAACPVCRVSVEEARRNNQFLSGIAGDLLDMQLSGIEPATHAPPLSEGPGARIGPYKLLQLIGEGGFGSVFMAEQVHPVVRRVAVKIIKLGMDTKQVIARFEAERQALAMMEHLNIARVLDAGSTETGRPYFVMELVRGVPITEYCDAASLSTDERLSLFLPVCQAVQHAHQKGIIHRDLKPSNVLVTMHDGVPVPKVIDFGIAKATNARLTEKTLFTEHRQLVGTLEYMSPEQAEMSGLDIDTRSDIYSLGVLLYEIMVGCTPFDGRTLRQKGYAEIQRIIREDDPPKPSTRLATTGAAQLEIARRRRAQPEALRRQLSGEIDWIVMKCLEKNRMLRYDSATALAEDLHRHRTNLPVRAGPHTSAYLLRKFVRRHQGRVLAASAVLAALVLGLAGTLAMWRLATIEATNARAAETEQRKLAVSESAARRLADAKTAEAEDSKRAAEVRRKEADYSAYIANLFAADASLSMNEPARVRARLDACLPSLRGWEWRWLDATADRSLAVLSHEGMVESAVVSPLGDRIVSASTAGTAKVWDTASGAVLAVLHGHESGVQYAAFSPSGDRVATASTDRTARVWDAATGAQLAVLCGHTAWVQSSVFSPFGDRIATASYDKTARVWDARTGQELAVMSGHEERVQSVAFSPLGDRIVTAAFDRTARVWDARSGKQLAALIGHDGPVQSAAFDALGDRVVTASVDGTVRVWDADTGRVLVVCHGHGGQVGSVAFGPSGDRILAAVWDNTARVWDASTGAELVVLRGHHDQVYSAAFSPAGDRVVTASKDDTARVWDATTGAELGVLRGHQDEVLSAAFSPSGNRIVTASRDRTMRVWDANDSKTRGTLLRHRARVQSAAFSPSGDALVTASDDRTVRIWDSITGSQLAVLRGHDDRVLSAAFSPSGDRLVTASADHSARVWDPDSRLQLHVLRGHSGWVHSAAFNPSGDRIVTASHDKTARVWNAGTGREMAALNGHEGPVRSAAFNSLGDRIVTASYDKTARVWDADTCQQNLVLRGHGARVQSAAFSPAGDRIVTASDDTTVRVWDSRTGNELMVLRGHGQAVRSALFCPSGDRILSVGNDNTARVWDADSGAELAVLRGHESWVVSAAWSCSGDRLVTAAYDSTARVWDAMPYRERFPVIALSRIAETKIEALVREGLANGRPLDEMARRMVTDPSFSPEERRAVRAEFCAIEERE